MAGRSIGTFRKRAKINQEEDVSQEGNRRLSRFVLAAVLAAIMTIPVMWQRGTINNLREENGQLSARVKELTAQSAEAASKTTPAKTPPELAALPKEQLHELMRLRAEITALRRQTNAPSAAVSRAETNNAVIGSAAPVEQGNIEARPPWRNAGFAQPIDAASTVFWAAEQGQVEAMMSGMTPEAQAEVRQRIALGKVTPENLKLEAASIAGFRPSPNHPSTENETYLVMDVAAAPQSATATAADSPQNNIPAQTHQQVVRFQKIGNQWLYAGKLAQ